MPSELKFDDENKDIVRRASQNETKGHFFRNMLMKYSGGLIKSEMVADSILTILALLFFILAFRSFTDMTEPPLVEIVPSPVGDNPLKK